MEGLKDSAAKKPKRLTSVVWNHFERVRKADSCYALCVHCNKKLSGSSNSGTTHLRNHLIRCLKRSNYDVTHLFEAKGKKTETSFAIADVSHVVQRQDDCTELPIVSFHQEQRNHGVLNVGGRRFSQQRSHLDLTCMMLLHGYPLTMVEDAGFRDFVKNLQPVFEVVPNGSIELSCTQIYEKEKRRVHELISRLNGRFNIAVEKWSCPENNHYLCLTAQFIDDVWKLRRKVLNFVTLETAHTEDMLSEVIIKCLLEWGIECKLFAMTFDDCFTDDDIVEMIKNGISQNRPFFSNGQLFDIRSAAHVVNLMVQDAIEALRKVSQKIRERFRYVKSSREIQVKFNEIAQEVGINCTKNLVLDSPARWSSTYYMVETALHYKDAFCFLEEHDPAYNTSLLSETEWEWASSINGYLKLFVEITNVFAGSKCPTANIYFPEICDVHIQLIEWCKSSDSFLSCMASKMKAKFDRHWSKCSLALAIAAILDPRFKMKLVEYYYSQIYGSTSLDRIKEVSEGINELFSAYSICSTLVDQGSTLPGSSLPGTSTDTRDRLKGFDKFLHETSQSQTLSSDLDKYLEEPVFPRNCDFNILNWWKVHTPRYPVLSMMARDVLGTPMSNVSLDMEFSTGGRMLDAYRSSLSPDVRQALICTHDWLQIEQEELLSSSPLAICVE